MRALVLCSGGVDSTTLLAMAVEKYGSNEVARLAFLMVSVTKKNLRLRMPLLLIMGLRSDFWI